MNVDDWIAKVDDGRERDELLARGRWHGYTASIYCEAPMRGELFLVRWEEPTITVSHDDPEKLLGLARGIERALLERKADTG